MIAGVIIFCGLLPLFSSFQLDSKFSGNLDCEQDWLACDENGLLTNITLSGANLSGRLYLNSSEFTAYANVSNMNFSSNALTGPIPPELGKFIHLTYLSLASNSFSGTIPSELFSLSSLQFLDLGGNQLYGPIPSSIGAANTLTYLNLANNYLRGTIPSSISNIISLSYLSLSNNTLIGTIPEQMNKLSLSLLDLSVNNLNGSFPSDIGNTNSLINLNISCNNISGTIPSSFFDYTSLVEFAIVQNNLTGTISKDFSKLVNLKSISVAWNKLSGSIPTEVGLLTQLTGLYLGALNLEGTIPTEIGLLKNLVYFTISVCRSISGTIPNEVYDLDNLEFLFINFNVIRGTISQNISKLTKLKRFVASSNSLTGTLPTEFGLLTGLKSFIADRNQLIGTVPSELGNLYNMTALDLWSNKLTGSIPTELLKLQGINRIALYSNRLCGPAPECSASAGSTCSNVPFKLDKNLPMCTARPTALPSTGTPNYPPSPFPSYRPSVVPSTLPSHTPTYSLISELEMKLSSNITLADLADGIIRLNNLTSLPIELNSTICNEAQPCLVGTCQSNLCVPMYKDCSTAVIGSACSSNGVCRIWEVTGSPTPFCFSGNSSCYARCSCSEGYHGDNCNVPSTDFIRHDHVFKSVCLKLNQVSRNELSKNDLDYAITSVSAVYSSSFGISMSTADICAGTINSIINATRRLTNSTSSDIFAHLMTAISSGIETGIALSLDSQLDAFPNSLLSDFTRSIDTITSILLSKQDIDTSISFNTSLFNITAYKSDANGFSDKIIAASNTSLGNSIHLPITGLSACLRPNDNSSVSLLQWNRSPYSDPFSAMRSSWLRWSFSPGWTDVYLANESSEYFYLSLSYVATQRFLPTNQQLTNYTVPGCKAIKNYTSVSCGCDLNSYDNYTASFRCNVTDNLCPSVRRKLKANHDLASTRDADDADVSEYAVLVETIGVTVADVITKNLVVTDLFEGASATSVLIIWVFLLIMGIVYFHRWDSLDRRVLIYAPKKIMEDSHFQSYDDLQKKRERIDSAFKIGTLPVVYANNNSFEENHVEFNRRGKLIECLQFFLFLLPCCFSEKKSAQFSLLIGGDIVPRMVYAISRSHPYLWFFTRRSMQQTRVIRYITTCKSILITMMISAIFYQIYFPADSNCPANNANEELCLSLESSIQKSASACMWDKYTQTCSHQPPPSSATFIITVSILTTILFAPVDFLFYLLLNVVCARSPDFSKAGIRAPDIFERQKPVLPEVIVSIINEERAIQDVISSFHGYVYKLRVGEIDYKEKDTLMEVLKKYGLRYNKQRGEVELSWISRLYFADIRSSIGYQVNQSHKKSAIIIKNLNMRSTTQSRDTYILQHFILENIHPVLGMLLRRQFAHVDADLPLTVHFAVWIISWILVLSTIVFLLAWMLLWASSTNQAIMDNWGINVLISFIFEIFIISIVRIFIFEFIFTELLRPYLKRFRDKLKVLGNPKFKNEVESGEAILKFLSPTSLTAQSSLASSLPSAHLLKNMNDIHRLKFDTEGKSKDLIFDNEEKNEYLDESPKVLSRKVLVEPTLSL